MSLSEQHRPSPGRRVGEGRAPIRAPRRLDPVVAALREIRVARGLSLEVLAERVGYDRTTVGRWERCEESPSLVRLRNWCDALGAELTVTEKTVVSHSVPERKS